jgi:hypothetical protein
MFLRHLNDFKLLYASDDGTGTTIESGSLSKDDILDSLNEEIPDDEETLELEPDKKTGKKDNKEDEEEGKEAKGVEDELEDELEDEEKLESEEDDDIVISVRRKDVLNKYPNIFKDFPHLDKAVYREQKYSEILPTLEDARIAAEKAETLDGFGKELNEGKTTTILQAVKEESPDAFHSLVDNYLGQLREVDENAYFHVLGNVIKHTIITMANSNDEDVKAAAAIVNKFIFRTDDFVPPTTLSKTSTKDSREDEIEQKRQEFRQEQLDTYVNTINTKVENSIKSAIDKNIDPRESMNPYVKRQAIRDCSEELEKQISSDKRFSALLDKLWERASESGFKSDSLDKIRVAYLSKAKNLLPAIIRKTRNEALKGLGKKVLNEDDGESRNRGPLPVGQTRKSTPNSTSRQFTGNSDKDKARALPKGTKTLDYLMRD